MAADSHREFLSAAKTLCPRVVIGIGLNAKPIERGECLGLVSGPTSGAGLTTCGAALERRPCFDTLLTVNDSSARPAHHENSSLTVDLDVPPIRVREITNHDLILRHNGR